MGKEGASNKETSKKKSHRERRRERDCVCNIERRCEGVERGREKGETALKEQGANCIDRDTVFGPSKQSKSSPTP